MSLLNGLSFAGAGLNTFAGTAAADAATKPGGSLLNNTPAPADPAPSGPGLSGRPGDPSTTPGNTDASHPGGENGAGNVLDPDTVARARQVYDGLLDRGMDSQKALAFAANAVQESRALPLTNPGDGGASHGLLQWNGDRLADFMSQNAGKRPEQTDLNTQLDFIVHELGGPESKANAGIDAAQGYDAKARAVSALYERPRNVNQEQDMRAGHAAGLVQAWGIPAIVAAVSGQAPNTRTQGGS